VHKVDLQAFNDRGELPKSAPPINNNQYPNQRREECSPVQLRLLHFPIEASQPFTAKAEQEV
jgi:hypothetical protein